MSLKSFQQVLADLVMDSRLRAAVVADPAAALADLELSERERRRLAALAADPGPGLKGTAVIHRSFRLSMLAYTLPMTCEALGPAGVKELTHAYWRENLPKNFYYVQEALRFGRFALAHLAARREGGEEHPYLPEVLEAELLGLTLQAGPPWVARAVPWPADDERWAARLAPGCGVLRFRRDPVAVISALAAERDPGDLPAGEHYLLLTGQGPENVDLRAIESGYGRALLACGEAASVRELLERLEAASAAPPRGVVEGLAAAGYLIFVPRPA